MIKLHSILNEIKLIPILKLEPGKLYDVKTWWTNDEWDNFSGEDWYEPYGDTIRGEEGWYWMLGLKYKGKTDKEYIFYDTCVGEDINFDIIDLSKNDIRPNKKS